MKRLIASVYTNCETALGLPAPLEPCPNHERGVLHTPNFLRSLVASMYFMRLSSMKAAHVAVTYNRVQEIRASRL